jgi:hypothetical protein
MSFNHARGRGSLVAKSGDVVAGKFPKKPENVIQSYEGRAYLAAPIGSQRYNPDTLIGTTGLRTYAKMRLDEQVKAVMNFKRDAIFARGWTFVFDEASSLSDEEKAFRIDAFKRIVTKIQGSFVDGLNCIASGRDYGYSVTEKVYGQVLMPNGKPIVGLSQLLGRDPTTFVFDTDEKGELRSVKQQIAGKNIAIDVTKFVHYVHNPEFDAYFGRSDLREAYKAWFWKSKMLDLWMTYGERLAGGFASIELDAASGITYNSPAWNSLTATMDQLSSVNGILLPAGCKLTVTTPPTTQFYEQSVEFFDLAIARSLLVPNLLGVSHTGSTGAYAQSQTQLEAFFWTLNSDKQRLEATLNEQLFQDLGDQNWGDGDYPMFVFNELSSERLKWIVENWTKLSTAGVVMPTEVDEARIREMLDMPEREEDSTLLADTKGAIDAKYKPKQLVGLDGQPVPAGAAANDPVAEDKITATAVRELFDAGQRSIMDAVTAAIAGIHHPEPQLDRSKPAATDRAMQRVHFAVIRDKQDSMSTAFVASTSAFLARGVSQLLGTDDDLTKLTDADVQDIQDLEFSGAQKGRLKTDIARALKESYAVGRDMAGNELERAHSQYTREQPDKPVVFARADFANLRGKAVDYFETNAFRMAGNLTDGARAIIQAELQNAVKFGKSPPETRDAIWQALLRKGYVSMASVRDVESSDVVQLIESAWAVSEEAAAAYLNNLARTNLFEAMNEARFAEFTDPAVADFVEGLEYSSILDDRTCFAAGTLVQLSNMALKPIEQVSAGDEVISGNGIARTVRARKVEISDRWREVEFADGTKVLSTPTHPLWSRRSAGVGWVEVRDLKPGDEVGARGLPGMQQTIPDLRQKQKADPLLMGLPSGDAGKELADSRVPLVQERVSRAEDLCGSQRIERVVLRTEMFSDGPTRWDATRGDELQVRDVQKAIHSSSCCTAERHDAATLFDGLPKTAGNAQVPPVSRAVRNKVSVQPDVLLGRLLSQVECRDAPGSDGPRGTDGVEHPVQARDKNRPSLSGLSGDGSLCDRGGRDVLAFERESEEIGRKKRRLIESLEAVRATHQHSSRDGSCAHELAADPCHDVVPVAERFVTVTAIRDIVNAPSFCYDLEIAGDHSYLVAGGIIAHNTDICRHLDDRKFRADSDVWDRYRPPNHFQCRSVLIPITTLDGWDGVESPTPTVEPAEGFK